MLANHKKQGNISAGICLVSLVGITVFPSTSAIVLYAVFIPTYLFTFWSYAKAKGYSGVVGIVLPCLSIIGLIILAVLKDKHPESVSNPSIKEGQYSAEGGNMFFRKKVDVDEYCAASLNALFSPEREKVWEQLRQTSNDPALSAIDRTVYINHIRAIMVELVLIAITKNCSMDIGSDARVFTWAYFKDHGATQIEEIGRIYNQAFGATAGDGVAGIVGSFSDELTGGKLQQDTMQCLHAEFYAVLRSLFEEFKSIKLTTKRG